MKFDQDQIYEAFGLCSHFIIFGDPRNANHKTLVKDTQTGKAYFLSGVSCFEDYRVLKVIPKWVKESIVKLIRDGNL